MTLRVYKTIINFIKHMGKLVIVESPAKANTISRYLGRAYKVLSSMGHVRDLPQKQLGVDIEKDFEPRFVITNKKTVEALRKAVEKAEKVYLATDNDREGEAIAYDLYETLKGPREKYLRVVFNEITRKVIQEAIQKPTEIDLKKVEAQRARRILDRLVGYLISPLLSKSLSGSKYEGLSAGRVQSVALRFICDREQEIEEFVPEEYWTIDAKLRRSDRSDNEFIAQLKRYKNAKPKITGKEEADRIKAELEKLEFIVAEVKEEESARKPLPPFITSTLQQTASSVLGFPPQKTMMLAQQLYEGVKLQEGREGLITYMRTDSLRVSEEAQRQLRDFIAKGFGEKYLSPQARVFKNKKAAQDAHEAIRPTSADRLPDQIKAFLSSDQYKLYRLIWERFVATQMADALYRKKRIKIIAGDYLFGVSGNLCVFDGFLKVLKLQPLKDEGISIPDLKENDHLTLLELLAVQRFTEPPKRYTEATLVKALEEKGIGRPSTYHTIVSTIQERGYVIKENNALKPTLLGFIATDFLKEFFPKTVQEEFTAQMEEELDQISEGELSRLQVLKNFYGPFEQQLNEVKHQLKTDGSSFRILTDVACEACGAPMQLRYWKGKRFLGCSRYPACQQTMDLPDNIVYAYKDKRVLLNQALKAQQEAQLKKATDKTCPQCGAPMQIKQSKYGRFYGCSRYPDCKTTLPLKERTEPELDKRCPTCGAPLQLRTSKYGRFYGCSRYPDCKTVVPVEVGVACPLCGGPLVERRAFYGCSNYPKCEFTVNQRPMKACPECRAGVLVESSENTLKCSNKTCTYQEPCQ